MSNLAEILAYLMDENDARGLVEQVGLTPGYIDFHGSTVNIWDNILREANRRTGRIRAIVDKVSERYPDSTNRLTIAMTEYIRGKSRILEGLNQSELSTSNAALAESKEFSPLIRSYMAELNRKIERLTQEQYRVIQLLRLVSRVRIAGCAGSGKTLVAAEKAIRLSGEQVSTLFLCHNPLLAVHLAKLVSGSGVSVASFGEWVADLAGMPRPSGADRWTKYDEPDVSLLDRALEVVLYHGPLYGAVIVDEGQDFRREWWDIVETCLDTSGPGILYIFHDDLQALLPHRASYTFKDPVIDLSRNCRNAGRIYSLMRDIHHEAPTPEEELKELGDVLFASYDHGESVSALRRAVRWIKSDRAHAPFSVLLRSSETFEQSILAGLSLPVSEMTSWKDEIVKIFTSFAYTITDAREFDPPPGGRPRVVDCLSKLSNEPTPTPADIELVRTLARSFRIRQEVRTDVRNRPRRESIRWRVDSGSLRLGTYRVDERPWDWEFILYFRHDDWHQGIAVPNVIRFSRAAEAMATDSVPVYTVGEYKGLEAETVLMFVEGPEPLTPSELFVGISRARMRLALVINNQAAADLPSYILDRWRSRFGFGAA